MAKGTYTLLVVASTDLADVALELVAEGIKGNLLTHSVRLTPLSEHR